MYVRTLTRVWNHLSIHYGLKIRVHSFIKGTTYVYVILPIASLWNICGKFYPCKLNLLEFGWKMSDAQLLAASHNVHMY